MTEDGGRGNKPRNANSSRSWKRLGTGFSSRISRMDHSSVNTLTLTETCVESFTNRTVKLLIGAVLIHEVCGNF